MYERTLRDPLQITSQKFLCLGEFWKLQQVWREQAQGGCIERDLIARMPANINKCPYQIVTFPNSKYNMIKHNTAHHNGLLQPSISFSNLSIQVRLFAIQWLFPPKCKHLTTTVRLFSHSDMHGVLLFGRRMYLSAESGEDLLSWMKSCCCRHHLEF